MRTTEIVDQSTGVHPGEEANTNSNQSIKYLTFFVNDKILGVDIHSVKEILEYDGVTHVPMTSAHIHGVLNLRGNIVPVINLSERIGFRRRELSPRSCIVIVEMEDNGNRMDLGIVVDSVNEVLDVVPRDIELPPSFGSEVKSEFIEGMSEYANNFIVLLDIERVLDIEELANLSCRSQ